MKVLVIVAHPNKSSFNHTIALTCSKTLSRNGREVIVHDLYEEHLNPILTFGEFPQDAVLPPDIQRHCDEVSLADGGVIIHPNWWGQPPAILIRMGGPGNQTRSGL
jgi:NAD(P)H dehydrogenase (quinone)